MFWSKYGVARHIYIPVIKRGLADFAVGADWTPAAGDVKISKDGGAAANVTNLPTAIAMGNGAVWDFSLTATEMQAAQVVVTVADSATKAVEDQSFIIETHGHASAQFQIDMADAVRAGLTALPNTIAGANGGLPLSVDTSGRVDVLKVNGTSQTAGDIMASLVVIDSIVDAIVVDTGTDIPALLATISGYLDTEIAAILADTNELQTDLVNGGRIDLLIDAIKAKTDNLPAAPAATGDIPSAATVAAAVWDLDATAHQTQGTFGQAIGDPALDADSIWALVNTNLDATVSSRLASASYTTPLDAAGVRAAVGLASANLDTQLADLPTNAELATALGTADDAVLTQVALVKAKTDLIPASPAATGDIPTADITAIKAKTDSLAFTLAGKVDANIEAVNGAAITGTGSTADPWGP